MIVGLSASISCGDRAYCVYIADLFVGMMNVLDLSLIATRPAGVRGVSVRHDRKPLVVRRLKGRTLASTGPRSTLPSTSDERER